MIYCKQKQLLFSLKWDGVNIMLCKAHYEKMLSKLKRLENTLNPYLFIKIESLPARAFRCNKQFHSIPDDKNFMKFQKVLNGAVTVNIAGLRQNILFRKNWTERTYFLCQGLVVMKQCFG